MEANYNKNTSIRLDPELKNWLYRRCHEENRSLSNLINTILKGRKNAEDVIKVSELKAKNDLLNIE